MADIRALKCCLLLLSDECFSFLCTFNYIPIWSGLGLLCGEQKCKNNQIPVPRDAIELPVRDDSPGLKVYLVKGRVSIVDSWAYKTFAHMYRAVA